MSTVTDTLVEAVTPEGCPADLVIGGSRSLHFVGVVGGLKDETTPWGCVGRLSL